MDLPYNIYQANGPLLVNGKSSKSISPQQAAGNYVILPLRVQVCSHISSGLRTAEPSVPAIHPTSKLAGILAYEVKADPP